MLAVAAGIAAPAQAADQARVKLGSSIDSLLAGPDGTAWVKIKRPGAPDVIGTARLSGAFRTVRVGGIVAGSALGPDGQARFLSGLRDVLRVDGTGAVTTAATAPEDGTALSDLLVPQSDGSLLATTLNSEQLARVAPDGVVTYATTLIPDCDDAPTTLADGAQATDGSVWFADVSCSRLLRLTPAGTWSVVRLKDAAPAHVASDAAGGVWFAGGHEVGHVEAAGTIRRYELPGRIHRVTDVAAAQDGSAWFASATCELVRLAPGAGPTHLPSPVPATQLAFAPAGDVLLASPARLVRTPIANLSSAGCDGMPPTTGRITVGGADADGRVSVAALRRHHGVRISVREPAAIDVLAFYPGRLGRQVNTTASGAHGGAIRYPVPKPMLGRFERSLAAGKHPSFDIYATFTDREGNPVQVGAKVRLTP